MILDIWLNYICIIIVSLCIISRLITFPTRSRSPHCSPHSATGHLGGAQHSLAAQKVRQISEGHGGLQWALSRYSMWRIVFLCFFYMQIAQCQVCFLKMKVIACAKACLPWTPWTFHCFSYSKFRNKIPTRHWHISAPCKQVTKMEHLQ